MAMYYGQILKSLKSPDLPKFVQTLRTEVDQTVANVI